MSYLCQFCGTRESDKVSLVKHVRYDHSSKCMGQLKYAFRIVNEWEDGEEAAIPRKEGACRARTNKRPLDERQSTRIAGPAGRCMSPIIFSAPECAISLDTRSGKVYDVYP